MSNKFEYKTVSTHTLAGLEEAERLQAKGWKIIRTGLFLITFERQLAYVGYCNNYHCAGDCGPEDAL